MCQIIHKLKNYSLPFDLINSTCITNPDGFGLMMSDGSGIYADKGYSGKNNDPQEVMKFLEEFHNEEVFIHFRFKTKGGVSSEDCHPFRVYNNFDREVFLMHNGTFSDYGSNTKVDSQDFGEKVVAPLYETFLKSGVRNPLQDKMFDQVMHKFINSSSKVVLMDNTGDHTIINYRSGDIYEDKDNEVKFWVSNLYSFNKYHRNTTHTTYYYGGKGGSYNGTTPFSASTKGTASTAVVPIGTPNSAHTTQHGNNSVKEVGSVPKRTATESYWKDILKLDSIDDILDMTNEDIGELVDLEPGNAKLLIKDLIYELYCCMYTYSPERTEETDPNEDSK